MTGVVSDLQAVLGRVKVMEAELANAQQGRDKAEQEARELRRKYNIAKSQADTSAAAAVDAKTSKEEAEEKAATAVQEAEAAKVEVENLKKQLEEATAAKEGAADAKTQIETLTAKVKELEEALRASDVFKALQSKATPSQPSA